MRVIVVGGTGTIGREVVKALAGRGHEVVAVGHSHGGHQVDISSKESIARLFDAVGPFDALVSAAGETRRKPLPELTDDDFQLSLDHKLMGQVNLVRLGLDRVRDGGSFTLTGGILAWQPMHGSAAISLVNAALEGFAGAAALDAPRRVRVNVVSPPWVRETLEELSMDPAPGLPAAQVAAAYVEAVEGTTNGEVLDARAFG